MADDLSNDLKSIQNEIGEKIKRIDADAVKKENRSSLQRKWDVGLRVTMAILAVMAPAFVTYSTTSGVGDIFKLTAIILSGVAGAGATLQAILALQQNYVRNAVDALDLYDIKGQLETATTDALKQPKDHEKYADLKSALAAAKKSHREIIFGRQRAYLAENQSPNSDAGTQ